VPLEALLSDEYNDARRKLIDPARAAAGLVPGVASPGALDGAGDASELLGPSVRAQYEAATGAATLARLEAENNALRAQLAAAAKALEPAPPGGVRAVGAAGGGGGPGYTSEPGEWTSPPPKVGAETPEWMRDTVHLCTADKDGNLVSAIPSGATFTGAPAVPGLGFCTSTRGMMLSLEPGCANTLAPGKRPRTTLSPSIATDGRGGGLAWGTPGGDGQDQWSLSWFLRHVHHGFTPQKNIDFPSFSSDHWPSSFGMPGRAWPLALSLEGRMSAATAERLRELGHKVDHRPDASWDGWLGRGEGKLNAVGFTRGGAALFAAANARGGENHALGR
jgi:gamma-glutamyltranspeptidase/glutathione hydrolase